jgi:hypothetical protein
MNTQLLAMACSIILFVEAQTVPSPISSRSTMYLGGPPTVRVAGKATGDVTAAEWSKVSEVNVIGCVPGARITSLTICIKDCKGHNARIRGKDELITDAMRTMVKNLPTGTSFTVSVTVEDADGKTWEVPAAKFVWGG